MTLGRTWWRITLLDSEGFSTMSGRLMRRHVAAIGANDARIHRDESSPSITERVRRWDGGVLYNRVEKVSRSIPSRNSIGPRRGLTRLPLGRSNRMEKPGFGVTASLCQRSCFHRGRGVNRASLPSLSVARSLQLFSHNRESLDAGTFPNAGARDDE